MLKKATTKSKSKLRKPKPKSKEVQASALRQRIGSLKNEIRVLDRRIAEIEVQKAKLTLRLGAATLELEDLEPKPFTADGL